MHIYIGLYLFNIIYELMYLPHSVVVLELLKGDVNPKYCTIYIYVQSTTLILIDKNMYIYVIMSVVINIVYIYNDKLRN